jgi:regulatory protein
VAFGSRPSSRTRGRGCRDREPSEVDEPQPDADPEQVARQICLHQLEFAPRTRAELAAVLAKRGVPDDVADRVLGRFTEVGIIDDALFSQMWVTSRHRGRGLAGRALQQELRRKGVDDDVARVALDTLDPDEERATARSLVERRLAATRGLTPDARVRRLAGMLARKGYSSGLAFAVVREALATEGATVDIGFDELQSLED